MRAFFQAGWRKAGTPLEMASTPVTAAPPEAKACSTTKSDGAHEQPVGAVGAEARAGPPGVVVGHREVAEEHAAEAEAEEHDHVEDEEVGGHGEDRGPTP